MKTLLALGAMGLIATASAGAPVTPENVMDNPAVYQGHNHEPGGNHRGHSKDSATSEDECHEGHHLKPDGDNDCDDPGGVGFSVPEDSGVLYANLALALGAGGAWLFARRRRKV